jgi:hypothetical protein
MRLAKDALDRTDDEVRVVVGRDDDADVGHGPILYKKVSRPCVKACLKFFGNCR